MSIYRWKACIAASLLIGTAPAAYAHYFILNPGLDEVGVFPPGTTEPVPLTGSQAIVRVENDGSEMDCTTQVTATLVSGFGNAVSVAGSGIVGHILRQDE